MLSKFVNVNIRELLVNECLAIAKRERNPYCLQYRGNLHHICEWQITQDFSKLVVAGDLDKMDDFYTKHIKSYGRYIKETSALRGEINVFYDRDWGCLTCLDKFGDTVHMDILKQVYSVPGSISGSISDERLVSSVRSQQVKDWFLGRGVKLD